LERRGRLIKYNPGRENEVDTRGKKGPLIIRRWKQPYEKENCRERGVDRDN